MDIPDAAQLSDKGLKATLLGMSLEELKAWQVQTYQIHGAAAAKSIELQEVIDELEGLNLAGDAPATL